MIKICVIGSSFLWTRTLVGDLLAKFEDQPLEIHFVDLILQRAELCCEWGKAASACYGRMRDEYYATTDRREALKDANAVIITISTGGFEAMMMDLSIPQKYGIFATVGDTAGPGGWSRSVRNIPIFAEFAQNIEELCPDAFVANYTNPMSTCTSVLEKLCTNPVSGFCHAYFETKDVIQNIFKLPNWDKISIEVAGMNHFTWVTGFKIDGKDGYAELRKLLNGRKLIEYAPAESSDEIGIHTTHKLFCDIYEATGYFCYPGDRHICEFLPNIIANNPELETKTDKYGFSVGVTKDYGIYQTSIDCRKKWFNDANKKMQDEIKRLKKSSGEKPPKSRETGADMIWAYLNNKTVVDAVNMINIGQISGLPLGACVETLGVVDGYGSRPVLTGNIPEFILEFMRPQSVCSKWIVEGMLSGDKNLVFQALLHDPQCSHLSFSQVEQLATELLDMNRRFVTLPF